MTGGMSYFPVGIGRIPKKVRLEHAETDPTSLAAAQRAQLCTHRVILCPCLYLCEDNTHVYYT